MCCFVNWILCVFIQTIRDFDVETMPAKWQPNWRFSDLRVTNSLCAVAHHSASSLSLHWHGQGQSYWWVWTTSFLLSTLHSKEISVHVTFPCCSVWMFWCLLWLLEHWFNISSSGRFHVFIKYASFWSCLWYFWCSSNTSSAFHSLLWAPCF